MSNIVYSNNSVDVMQGICLQQMFSTDVGMGLHFLQTYQRRLLSGCWGISSGGSLCSADHASSRPPRVLNDCVTLYQI